MARPKQKMTYQLHRYNNVIDYASASCDAIVNFIKNQPHSPVRIALSGGSSPKAVYEKMAVSDEIDWSKVELYQVDERFVPDDSEESNAKMIRQTLIEHINELKAFHTFDTQKSIEAALTDYENTLKQAGDPLFDLVLLGLGEDGHTASLFPHGPELKKEDGLVTHSLSPKGVINRLSLSFPAILNSRKIMFLIRGSDKKKVIQKWIETDATIDELPAKKILEHPDVEIFYDESI